MLEQRLAKPLRRGPSWARIPPPPPQPVISGKFASRRPLRETRYGLARVARKQRSKENCLKKGIRAHLITWEAASDSSWDLLADRGVGPKRRIALVLSPRLGSTRLEQTIEDLYAAFAYAPSDMINRVRTKRNPYPAAWHVAANGYGVLTCGHNPYLRCRLVSNLRVDPTVDPEEPLWDELPVNEELLAFQRQTRELSRGLR